MAPSFSNGGGGGGVGGGHGVSVRKHSIFMNTFLWYFFQTLTLFPMLLMVLSIYYWVFSSGNNNIRDICVISVAFSIISPSFIIPKLPQIAAVAIPIIQLYENPGIQLLNIFVWLVFGLVYPFPANILCYCLIAGLGLLKLYRTDGESSSFRLIGLICRDALGTSFLVFDREKKDGTGRWVDSSTGFSLLGLFVMTLLAHYLPPLVNPEKKKMMNEIEAILTEVAASEKKKMVNVDHVVNVAEAPILGSGTKSLLETV